MNQIQYIELRNAVNLQSVSFGTTTVTLFNADEWEKAQIGYSVHPNGQSLCGSKEGNWQASWIVIGDEDLCGDPIFTDLDSDTLSVYTAMHGAGKWEPVLIAESFGKFVQILERFQSVSKGREHPTAQQNNPLPEAASNAILDSIKQNNPHAQLDFWASWLVGFEE